VNILMKYTPCGGACLVIANAPPGTLCSEFCPWFEVAELYGHKRPTLKEEPHIGQANKVGNQTDEE
jgi:hypothetical protein